MREGLPKDKKKGIDSLIMITSWHLRKTRNDVVFNGATATATGVVERIREEAKLWVAADAKHIGCILAGE
ncbi:hypothetical protein PR202_ga21110 [Eleusine coracana subsp. coracana]|uniref:Uncharacterized protein n=1 Tax=Eleusine coracana subsp. coracana TaxID=191504 RepID=A0AAV5CYB5_ELECO|nr:hypothetical protein PR202_ga21110 [Eleusine coracana subsp. coracana]